MKYRIVIILWLVLLAIGCSPTSEVDSGQPEISPWLFGQNLWLTDGAEGRPGYIQEHLWSAVEQSGVKMVRIGGNGYDQKLPGLDTLEMWVRSIKEIGAEPMIQVSKYESSEKAAEVVKYFNQEKDLRVTYWAVGNEPYLIHHWTIPEISDYIKSHASAMKAVDSSIKIFAPDAAAYDQELYHALLISDRYSIAGRDENGNWYIDGVTFHNYPNAKAYTRQDVVFFSVSKMRGMIRELLSDMAVSNEKFQRFGEDELIWALTEFNITYDNPDDHSIDGIAVPSFINGQFWADVFAMSMEYGAFCVTPWCIQESDRASTYFGYIGGPPDFKRHSTYFHMQMMADHFGGKYVKMMTNHPYVKSFGSKSDDGITIMLMNQSSSESVAYDFSKINESTEKGILQISSGQNVSANFEGLIDPNTTLLFQFGENGTKMKHLKYSLEMAAKDLPPLTIE